MITLVDSAADYCTEFTPLPSRSSADARRLGRAYAAADCGQFADAMAELHAALLSFVEVRKAEAQPPERVIVAVKRALMNFGGLHSTTMQDAALDADVRNNLYEQVFRWTLNAYYATADSRE